MTWQSRRGQNTPFLAFPFPLGYWRLVSIMATVVSVGVLRAEESQAGGWTGTLDLSGKEAEDLTPGSEEGGSWGPGLRI